MFYFFAKLQKITKNFNLLARNDTLKCFTVRGVKFFINLKIYPYIKMYIEN